MNIRLIIENKEVELNETVQVAITKQFEELSNPTTIINDWSKTVSIPFTVSNNELFGYIFNADRLVTYKTQNNLLSGLTPYVRKWNNVGTTSDDYVADTLVNGDIVCPYIVERLQVGFQYLNNDYSNTRNYMCNNDFHTFDFVYHYDENIRLEFSFRNKLYSANNGEVYYVQYRLDGLGLTEGKEYTVSFKHRLESGKYIVYDISLSPKQAFVGINFNPLKKLNFRLEYGSNVIMTGYAKLNEIKQNDGKGTYEVTLFGELGKVFSEMKKITFADSPDDSDYRIKGEEYVGEYINNRLVADSWLTGEQYYSELKKKTDAGYRVIDIIGFAPNNSFSEGFDYKNFQLTPNSIMSFADVLGDKFTEQTGVEPDTAIPNGLLPREIGEFRSYLQLPFIYWNKLFQIFQAKSEEITGYKFELDDSWFNNTNPYWYNLVYMLKPFDMKGEESVTNYYKLVLYGAITWKDNLSAYTTPQTVPLHFTNDGNTETKPIADFTNNTFKMSYDYSVLFNTQFGLDLDATHYTNIRISPANGLVVSVQFTDSNNVVKQEFKYLMVDNAYSGDTNNYTEVARFDRQANGRFSFYPNLKTLLDKGVFGDVAKIQISAVWLNNTYKPFLDFLNTPFAPAAGDVVLHYYNSPTASVPLTVNVITGRHRSNTYFTLNTLWNNERNLFDEILRYCKMYRIGIFVNEYEKKITFKPYTKYFEEYTVVDWTDKVDKSKDYIIKPVTFDNKYVLFNYDDGKTNLGEIYKEKYGFNYGDYRLTTEYNFNNSTKNLFEKTVPSIVYTDNVLSWSNISDNYTIKYSFPAEIFVNNRDKEKKQVDIFGAFFFYNGLGSFDSEAALYLRPVKISDDTIFQQSNSNYCYTQGQGELIRCYTYPKLDIVFGNNLCLFNQPKENYTYINNYGGKGNIYSNFWNNYIGERYNVQNKLITCYVMLKPTEYNQFKWNQFVKIGNQLCVINKIYDYDVTANVPTKVDLITIQDISGYTNDSFNYDYIIASTKAITIPYDYHKQITIKSTRKWEINSDDWNENLVATPTSGEAGITNVIIGTTNQETGGRITFNLLDDNNNVIGTDYIDVTVGGQSSISVDGEWYSQYYILRGSRPTTRNVTSDTNWRIIYIDNPKNVKFKVSPSVGINGTKVIGIQSNTVSSPSGIVDFYVGNDAGDITSFRIEFKKRGKKVK